MRYHQWPDKGVGTLPAYTFNRTDGDKAEYTHEAVPLGHAYDWDNMPLNGMSNWNSAQKDAVATLLRDCAVMLQSDFGLSFTSAYIGDVPTTLVQYMKYDASIDIDRINYYTEPLAWVRRIEENIDNNGPVAYAGYTDKSGHAFIVDGYDEQDFLHVNWGWNGSDNGFFAAPDGFQEYTKDHVAVLGAKKNAGGEATAYIELDNLKSSATSYAPGTTFTVTAMFYNMGVGDFNGSVAIAKYNRSGEFIEQVSDPLYITDLRSNYGWSSKAFPCKLSAQIKAGDYMGIGDAVTDKKKVTSAMEELALIAGQQPVMTKARKSIATFKLREGMPIGCKVTLRSDRMYEFLERLVNMALPRIRDFHGITGKNFDGRGNFAFGVKEQIIFPEINYEKVDEVRGLDIVICTTAKTDEEAKLLLTSFNLPYKK